MKKILSLILVFTFLLASVTTAYATEFDPTPYKYVDANYTPDYYESKWKTAYNNYSVAVLTAHSWKGSDTAREWVRIFGRLETMQREYPAYSNWAVTKTRVGMNGTGSTWIQDTVPRNSQSSIPEWAYDIAGYIPKFGSYVTAARVLTNSVSGGTTVDISGVTKGTIETVSYSGLSSTVSLPNSIGYREADGNTDGKRYGFDGRFLFNQSTSGAITVFGNVQYRASMLVNGSSVYIYPWTADVTISHSI